MPETTVPATELASQYINQVTGDLETNVKEQERIGAEIAALQEQLAALQRDHSVLVNVQKALGIAETQAEPAAEPQRAEVPSPRSKKAGAASGGKAKARTSTAAPRKSAAKKSPVEEAGTAEAGTAKTGAAKAGTAKAGTAKTGAAKAGTAKTGAAKAGTAKTGAAKAAQPTLVELIRRHLTDQKEPRSAAEISTALGKAHPKRDIAAKVVRVTLEGLVAKSQAERTKQGRSVFYSAPASEPALAPETQAQTEVADH
jgi:cell division septum initiation protein DivIVA